MSGYHQVFECTNCSAHCIIKIDNGAHGFVPPKNVCVAGHEGAKWKEIK